MALKSGKFWKSWKVGQSSYSKEPGHHFGEDVYAAFGRTIAGRYMSVFFVYTRDGRAIIVSARDMSDKEREKYGQ